MNELVTPYVPAPRLLDADAYSTLAFSKLEDDAVWTREWICIGVDDDIQGAGDLLPFTVGDHAVHVQRLASGRLAGRFNLAQHGGCRIVPLQCRQGAKTSCSFTSCGHSRDRVPIKAADTDTLTPEMYQYLGLRPERLLGVRVASAAPLVFVHLDPAGGSFTPDAAVADMACDEPAALRHESAWLEQEGNWKHVGQRLAAGSKRAGSTSTCGIFESTEYTDSDSSPVVATWRFPNLIVLSDSTSRCAIILQPIALQRTLCRISTYGPRSLARWHALLERRAAASAIPTDAMQWLEATLATRIAQSTASTLLTGTHA
ncbi:hypothetical protein [Paraburkholderia sp. BCC1886]|uniref:hypothetical protein n=1 Tax=Paraburkholderia sp. BCC1886 TaxID=2562670 RepID=UPI00118421A6|nr:hypothetical protein [Paraburkholderia sp. BCC1886]